MSGSSIPGWRLATAALLFPLFLAAPAPAYERSPQRPAIILAAFGTTEPKALDAILNVEKKVQAAFPDCDVFLGFTANRVREVWRERAGDRAWRAAHPAVPERLYEIANPLMVMAKIQNEGARPIFVQSLHIVNGTEFEDQKAIVTRLAQITAFQEAKRPFPYLSLGDSALGRGTPQELSRAAVALKPLADAAEAKSAALVLMGHGNDARDVKTYRDFAAAMTAKYGPRIFLALVEGRPGFDDLLKTLEKAKIKKVLLAPLMLVAGDHALNDMAGEEPDSLASRLKAAGVEVETRLQGLGSEEAWAEIYLDRIKSQLAAYNAPPKAAKAAKAGK